jgi:uncharacterized repeat protein (TIGR01451 family)
VTPATVVVGGHVTATITVRNLGPDTASNVVLTAVNEPNATLVSTTPSQGSCANGTCQLGSIPAGAQVTITVVARVDVAGAQVDTVLVRGTSTDPAPANNVASGIVRGIGAFVPPAARPVCATVRLSTHAATVATPFTLRARVADRNGRAIAGTAVRAHGVGVDLVRKTDRHGVAHFYVNARRTGILTVRGGAAARCIARVGVSTPLSATESITG